MVPASPNVKAQRDRQLGKLMNELSTAREKVFQASQKLTDYEITTQAWNEHQAAMRKFYDALGDVYDNAARMLHMK